jgi:TRAP transporter TAXI family solute receptor
MRRVIYGLVAVSTIVSARVSIVTGGKGGTYYPFGQQIAKQCGSQVGGLDVISTKGSVENIKLLLNNPIVKFAIVQYDVLLYYMNNQNVSREFKDSVKKLKIVMPLYDEDIHLMVNKNLNINSLADFKNLRVSVSKQGSGTFVTARNVAKYTKVRWKKTYTYNTQDSIKALSKNTIDAFFFVAGAPAEVFNVQEGKVFDLYKKKFKIFDLSGVDALNNIYSSSEITQEDYPWMDSNVNTKAVRSVLITYNYKKYQPSYRRVKDLYQCLYENINTFQSDRHYHPKWQEVDPTDFKGVKWDKHPAVKEYLEKLEGSSRGVGAKVNEPNSDEVLDNFFKNL